MDTPDKALLAALAADARALAKRNQKVSADAVVLNIITSCLLMGPVMSIEDRQHWTTIAISDEWLEAAASLPAISRKGLELLAKALQVKGWVSVAEAIEFVELEELASKAQTQQADALNQSQMPGAAALLARAESDLPGTIDRFAESAMDAALAVGGVLAFSYEKTILVGKGLGAAARFVRNLRG